MFKHRSVHTCSVFNGDVSESHSRPFTFCTLAKVVLLEAARELPKLKGRTDGSQEKIPLLLAAGPGQRHHLESESVSYTILFQILYWKTVKQKVISCF